MFCQKCGTSMPESASACANCNTPSAIPAFAGSRSGLAGGGAALSGVAGSVKEAWGGAVSTLLRFAADPVGRLGPAYEAIGPAQAKRAGLSYAVLSIVCFLAGGYMLMPFRDGLLDFLGVKGTVQALLFACLPFAVAALGSFAGRKLSGGHGGLDADFFAAGSALIPASLAMLVSGMVGYDNPKLMLAIAVLAGCSCTLMLFAGYTRVSKVSERVATLLIPLVVMLTLWLAKELAGSILSGGFGGGGFNPGRGGNGPPNLWGY